MKIKICGITRYEDGMAAVDAGADLLGFNFYPPSPRYLTPPACRKIVERLRNQISSDHPVTMVGVFVNALPMDILKILDECGLDLAQCSGDEPPQTLAALGERGLKALRPRTQQELSHDFSRFPNRNGQPAWLIDAYQPGAYGGTGQKADLQWISQIQIPGTFLLAGGLTPQNVGQAVAEVQPWGVDVASGVESTPGIKDHQKMRAFIQAARGFSEERKQHA